MSEIVIALGIALAVSLAGNGWLATAYLGVRDERTEVKGERDQARSAANTCSEQVDQLQAVAATRAASAVQAIAAARKADQAKQSRAQQILSTPATVPGNDCKSADDRARSWIAGRAKP